VNLTLNLLLNLLKPKEGPVVTEDPVPELKRVSVDNAEVADRGFSNVSHDRVAGEKLRNPLKIVVGMRGLDASSAVRLRLSG